MWIAWFMYAALCLALIALLFNPFTAHAEYYKMLSPFTKTPVVCISEIPNEEKNMYKVLSAAISWRESLGTQFDYKLKYKTPDSDCNIMVNFVPALESGISGRATCYYNFCDIEVAYGSDYYISNTVKHEIGHAFGLGHRLPTEKVSVGEIAKILLSNDVMTWANGPYRWILQSNVDALNDMYGIDGWIPNNKSNYNYYGEINNTKINVIHN